MYNQAFGNFKANMAGPNSDSTPLLSGTSTPIKVAPTQVARDVYVLFPEKEGLGQNEDPKYVLQSVQNVIRADLYV